MSTPGDKVILYVPSNSVEDASIETKLTPQEAETLLREFVAWMEKHATSDMGAVTQIAYGHRYRIIIQRNGMGGFRLEHDVGNSSVARHFVDKVLVVAEEASKRNR